MWHPYEKNERGEREKGRYDFNLLRHSRQRIDNIIEIVLHYFHSAKIHTSGKD
jgi:hypothetical protein